VHNLSLVVIDHRQMALVAYVGNQAWQGDSRYAPGVDIARRPRSTGSLLKPFLYGLMLDEGLLMPTQLVPDTPSQFGGYAPKNFDREFRGAVPAHRALAQSLNVPAVRLLRDYGVSRFQHQLQAMGLTSLFRPADDYGLTLILGGAEASLWEMTSLYARLTASARGGLIGDVPGVSRFQGEVPERYPGVISQGAAWLSLQAMIEAARPGNDALWRDFAGSQRIAWKTGTSYGLRDAWAIGSNGRYTVGVWAGNAGGEAAPTLTGQASAAPLLFALFDRLGASSWFPRPDESLKWVNVCAGDGYLAGDQCPSVAIQIPRLAEPRQTSPHYRRLHLDASGQFRVHGDCESPGQMQARDWFVLPPAQAHFWKNHRSDYRPLPPWRPDCLARARELDGEAPMELLYPPAGGRLYLPVDLDGKRSRLLLQAVHHQSGARLFWHLNDKFLGETRQFHQQAVALDPGWQRLKLVDEQGYEVEVWFEVLGSEQR
jgi:penicillin-binding protein 1C